jgi:hypothetical protein
MTELGSHHRKTLEKLVGHEGRNVEWHDVRSLLEAVGTVSAEHDGKLKVTVATTPKCCIRRTARTSTSRRWSTCAGSLPAPVKRPTNGYVSVEAVRSACIANA